MPRGKRRRAKVPSVLDLLREGIPPLSKGNSTIQSTAHIEDIGHDEAAVFEHPVTLLDENEMPFTAEGVEEVPSVLLLRRGLRDGFTYQNETKIQNLVGDCLHDALTLLDLNDDFKVEAEFSVFSYRPDILVVSHGMIGIILVIEVKKPGVDVLTSHGPGGQVYDYLIGNLLAGVSHPFAVLTTYDEMVIAHLDDEKSKEILKSNAGSLGSDIPENVLNLLGIGGSEDVEPVEEKVKSTIQGIPESKLNRVFESIGNNSQDLSDVDRSDDDDDDDDDYTRAVFYTQPFRGKEIMKALILAIRCGLESVAHGPGQSRIIPMEGATVDGTCALVNRDGLVWKTMPKTIQFKYSQFPGCTTRKLYLWRDLGRGAKGRVFLACNTEGKACAVKFFIIDHNVYHRRKSPKETREEWIEQQMTITKQEAETEKKHWETVYGEKFKDQVWVKQFNKLWCLMMPYFDPLGGERREQSLWAVQEFLEKCKRKHLRYRDEDLRWRHVGSRGDEIFVFDLGSLEECNKDDDFDIPRQIEKLRAKLD